jgi:hypothetical protein
MKSVIGNDIVVRAFKTFCQAFLATLAVSVVSVHDWNGVKAVVVGAVAAGISAAWNYVRATV